MSEPLRLLEARHTGRLAGWLVFNRDPLPGESFALTLVDGGAPVATAPADSRAVAWDSGYRRAGASVCFVAEAARVALAEDEALFVVGDFNGWVSGAAWRLAPGAPGELALTVPAAAVCPGDAPSAAFKFVTSFGRWIEPAAHAPNRVTDPYGNQNLRFHPACSGAQVFTFTLPACPLGGAPTRFRWVTPGAAGEVVVAPGEAFFGLVPGGPLGATTEPGGTRFRVFAPRASAVAVEHAERPGAPWRRVAMHPGADGVWEAWVPGAGDGGVYRYFADGRNHDATTAFDGAEPILDPYAKAALGPAGPGFILAPERFPRVAAPFKPPAPTDLVVAEIHVLDTLGLAGSPAAERPASAGLWRWLGERLGVCAEAPPEASPYAALADFMRRPDNPLRTLGVNAVELLPLQERDAPHPEARPAGYHWGYMPVNWFSPTAALAADPARASHIAEVRDLVAACHEAGLAVILDVVYNHTGEPNALLRLDKHHWFTDTPAGELTNHSGCGNDLRADTPAALRLIVESLRHWVEAYDVDGFRFDLAELIGKPALDHIRRAVAPAKPGLIFIAEPWSFRGHIGAELRGSGYASWSDAFRDTLSHYVWGARPASAVLALMTSAHAAPADVVNYTESHDDLCWLDRITENPHNDGTAPTRHDIRRTRLMAACLFTAPGAVMIAAGQEFLRTKGGHHNTYIRGDLSRLDPARAAAFADTRAFFRDAIALRLSDRGRLFRPAETPAPGFYRACTAPDGVSFALEFNANDALPGAGRALFALNPTLAPAEIVMPAEWSGIATPAHRVADTAGFSPGLGGDDEPRVHAGRLLLPPLGFALWLA